MTGFIDIHTHILPGLDDGARNFTQGLELLHMAYAKGTRAILFTPHYRGSYRKNTPELLRKRFEAFQNAAAEQLPAMQLYLGQEIYCDADTAEAVAEGSALTLNDTDWVLLEFSPGATSQKIRKGVDSFLYYGYRPVIAHVERCDAARQEEDLVEYLLSRGAKLQLNADSILGKNGRAVAQFCHKLLNTRTASFIASDAHDPNKRTPVLRECFLFVHKKYGAEYAHQLFYDNPLALIDNGDF